MNPIVNGATRLYGIIGDPIEQVKSPEAFTARFRAAGQNALLVPLHVKPESFDETVHALKKLANLHGLIATLPYKARVLAHVERVLPTGRRVGAINAMRRDADGQWSADMFDGKGFLAGIRSVGVEPKGQRVLLLGAGGAGSAIADALAEAGARSITVFDQDQDRAAALWRNIKQHHPRVACVIGQPALADHDVLVNATPVGMAAGDGLPAEFGPLPARLFVADIVPRAEGTLLLERARASGCRTMAGRAMVDGQVEEIARFFGVR
jgi:shikimate dehydrogenase